MTVGELRKRLESLPDDMPVLVREPAGDGNWENVMGAERSAAKGLRRGKRSTMALAISVAPQASGAPCSDYFSSEPKRLGPLGWQFTMGDEDEESILLIHS